MDGDGDGEEVNPGELPDEGDGDPVVPASRPVTSVPVRPRTTAGGRPLTSRGRPATSRPGTPATPGDQLELSTNLRKDFTYSRRRHPY